MHRIYRMKKGRKIAGICGGIADQHHLDPTAVRLAAIFLTVLTGIWPGAITYLAGWFLIPEEDDSEAC